MSPYPVIPLQIHRTGIEVCLHCPEAILNHPSAAVSLEDCRSRTVKVRADSIEAVEEFLLSYHLLIERVVGYLGELPVTGKALRFDKPLRVVLAFPVQFG